MKNRSIHLLAVILALVLSLGNLAIPAFAAEGIESDPVEDTAETGVVDPGPNPRRFNCTNAGDTFSIRDVNASEQSAVFANDTTYGVPMALEAGKTYELQSRWEYNPDATEDISDVYFGLICFSEVVTGELSYFSCYLGLPDETHSYDEQCAETIWFKSTENLTLEFVPNSLKVWSDGKLSNGIYPDSSQYNLYNNYLGSLLLGYDALDGTFAPGQACYVSIQVTTKVNESVVTTEPPASEQPSSEPSSTPSESPEVTPPVEEETYDPSLPHTFKGEAASANRKLFTEENRPDYATINSITNNPTYGDETQFFILTDIATGREYREGTVKLEPGHQYSVQILIRNDAGFRQGYTQKFDRYAEKVSFVVSMPYELGAGAIERFSATVSAENTMPLAVSAGVSITSDYGLSLQYSEGSAAIQWNGGADIEPIDSEKLFRDGVYLGRMGSGKYGVVSFTIRAVADDSVPAAELSGDGTIATSNAPGSKGTNIAAVAAISAVTSAITSIILLVVFNLLAAKKKQPDFEVTIYEKDKGSAGEETETPADDHKPAPQADGEAPAEPKPAEEAVSDEPQA